VLRALCGGSQAVSRETVAFRKAAVGRGCGRCGWPTPRVGLAGDALAWTRHEACRPPVRRLIWARSATRHPARRATAARSGAVCRGFQPGFEAMPSAGVHDLGLLSSRAAHTGASIGVLSGSELAPRLASSAQARKPPTARKRSRRGAWTTGCDCGAGAHTSTDVGLPARGTFAHDA
jgi:hypothetical protein